jgi:hypothetical protein
VPWFERAGQDQRQFEVRTSRRRSRLEAGHRRLSPRDERNRPSLRQKWAQNPGKTFVADGLVKRAFLVAASSPVIALTGTSAGHAEDGGPTPIDPANSAEFSTRMFGAPKVK